MPNEKRESDRPEAFPNTVVGTVCDEFRRQRRENAVEVSVLACPGQLRVLGVVPRDRELIGERRDRAALQEVELAVTQGAFDVDRTAHDLLELHREPGDARDVSIRQDAAVRGDARRDREIALAHGVAVRRDRPGGDGVPEPARRVHHDDIARAAHRVGAERDRGSVRWDHELHEHRDPRRSGDAALPAVCGRAVRIHRPPALEQRVHDRVDTADIEHGLVLARERCVARVFADRRRPHRDPRLALANATREVGIRRGDELLQPRPGRDIAIERVAELVERRHVETEAGRHAERGRETAEVRSLSPDRRGVQRTGVTQPSDMHGGRV